MLRPASFPPLKRHRANASIHILIDDILADILSRLPLDLVTRCKCISKLWASLISKLCIPKLISAPMHSLIYGTYYLRPDNELRRCTWCWSRVLSSPYHHILNIKGLLPFRHHPADFLDCCNGILLYFNPSAMNYWVCNPTTRQMLNIPNSPGNNKPPKTTSLIFHPPHHKLVYISPSKPTTSMNIFSPETGKWDVHELGNLSITRRTPRRQIFLGKSIYRLSGTGHVFKFDVIEEIGHKTIQLPKDAETTDINVGCIGTSQGSLHFGWDDRRSKMMVWKLEAAENDAHWVLKHTIYLTYFAKHSLCINLCDTSLFNSIAFHPTSDDIFVGNTCIIFCYDPHSKRLDVIRTLEKGLYVYKGPDCAYPFSINLTSLDALMTP